MPAPVSDDTFIHHVHRALHHLYDPVDLRLSPLAGLLGITRGDVPSALRKTLLDGIAALKPGPRLAPDSNAWRVYQVLCYRFEEQSSQDEVAAQMAISPRQVRRLEFTAIRALASHLAAQYGLGGLAALEPVEDEEALEENEPHAQELDWLRKSSQREICDIYQLVESALRTGESIFRSSGGEIHASLPPGLPPAAGQATTLRQVLLNLILAAVRSSPAGAGPQVQVSASAGATLVWIDIRAAGQAATSTPPRDVKELLDLSRSLVEVSGGSLELPAAEAGNVFQARLGIPAAELACILFVDDNEDSLRLFERYLEGTRFHFSGTRDPRRATAQAEECGARAIVLDIMLPEIDGWELLGRIRNHPRVGSVPVIISTILPHEALAHSLGAAGFLRKPVSRDALLETLNRVLEIRAGQD